MFKVKIFKSNVSLVVVVLTLNRMIKKNISLNCFGSRLSVFTEILLNNVFCNEYFVGLFTYICFSLKFINA